MPKLFQDLNKDRKTSHQRWKRTDQRKAINIEQVKTFIHKKSSKTICLPKVLIQ